MLKKGFDTVVVRFGGEIGIKAKWTRKLYERRLVTNIKAVLKKHGIPYTELVRRFGRLYIKTVQAEQTAEKLSRVFGISSLSPAMETTSSLDDIIKTSVSLAGSTFKKAKTFSVRCRRIGKHPYTSQEVCRQVGQSIRTQLPKLNLRVDLNHPQQTLNVEVREEKAFVFTDTTKASGGLPLGTQPKLVCLLKGDTSSAVACWMTMKRGCPPILVHYEDWTLTNKSSFENVVKTAKRLMEWSVGFPRRLYVVEPRSDLRTLTMKHSPELSGLLCKRLMLRIAQGIARMKNAEGIVTGDTLGEKANQTLYAFRIQDEALEDYPVYRPLIGFDAHETKEAANKIGLKKTLGEAKSKTIKNERTAPIKLEDIKRIENELNIEKTVKNALQSLKTLDV